jgi:uncharacterized membrane protein YeaQ/YmgE (transglycosylase-associated protein family)
MNKIPEHLWSDAAIHAWLFFAALAGGLTSLALLKPLDWFGRISTVLVGMAGAAFIAPAIIERFFPLAEATDAIVAFTYYMVSAVAMSAFPPFLKWVSTIAGDPTAFFRIKKPNDESK